MAKVQVKVQVQVQVQVLLQVQYNNICREHRLVKIRQDQVFNSLHDMRDPRHLLLQFDFSENAEVPAPNLHLQIHLYLYPQVVEQDEVQSAHWWHLQVP